MSRLKNVLCCIGLSILLWLLSRFIPAAVGVLTPDSPFMRLVLMIICLLLGWWIANALSKGRHSTCIRVNLYIWAILEITGLFTTLTYIMKELAFSTGRYSTDTYGIPYSDYIKIFGTTFVFEIVYIIVCFFLARKTQPKLAAADETLASENIATDDMNIEVKDIEQRPTPGIGNTNTSVCKKCGKQLLDDSTFCRFCGKRVAKKKNRSLKRLFVAVLLILLVVISAAIFAFFIINYQSAITAMDNQEFVSARLHFNKIPFADELFPDECAYIDACMLMESGEYLQAFRAFEELSIPVPSSIKDNLVKKMYAQAQEYYRNNSYPKAEEIFTVLGNYSRSKDYLILIACQNTADVKYYNDLLKLIGFEDAKQILTKYSTYLNKFINGEWKSSDKKYYLKADTKYGLYSFSYNIPAEYVNEGYCRLNGGIYFVGGKQLLKISIVDKNTISVYSYKSSKNYKLIRQ